MALEPRQARTQLTGQTAAHYRIMEMIGHGGMGEVYRAHDDHLDRSVAIKALPPRLAGDDIARRRFIRETRVASQVIHPYVATVFVAVDLEPTISGSESQVTEITHLLFAHEMGHALGLLDEYQADSKPPSPPAVDRNVWVPNPACGKAPGPLWAA